MDPKTLQILRVEFDFIFGQRIRLLELFYCCCFQIHSNLAIHKH